MQCRSNRFSLRNFSLGFSKKQAPSAPSGFAPCRLSPARGVGRRIGPLAQTLSLQERGRAPFTFAPCRLSPARGSAGLLGLWPIRSAYRSAGALPSPPNRRWRPGGSAGLSGLWPIRSAYRSANALPSPSPRAAVGGPGGRPVYWAFGPNARPTGARTRPLRLRPVPPFEPDQKKRTVDKIPLM